MNSRQASEFLTSYRQRAASLREIKNTTLRRKAAQLLRRTQRVNVNEFAAATIRRTINPASASEESLVWFWFNHFNVFWRKGLIGAALPDYVENAIRPNLNRQFKDLLLATMTHPAMLVYLDNSRNMADNVNENYARELLELHTLGIDGGYSQKDVQEVARALTGLGLRPTRPVNWSPSETLLVREKGEFLFDPRKHDFDEKIILGHSIPGSGFGELEILAKLLGNHASTARLLSKKLCWHLFGEHTSPEVTESVAAVFSRSEGNLESVYSYIKSIQFPKNATRSERTFKDPYRWLTSSLTVLFDGQPIQDTNIAVNWLSLLGQPLFGCSTPNGYSLKGSDWVSSGQLTQRFETARELVALRGKLGEEARRLDDLLTSGALRNVYSSLGVRSKHVVDRATSAENKASLIISSPEFMYW